MRQIQKSAMENILSSASASDGWRREVQEQLIVSWSPIEKKGDGCSEGLFGTLRPNHRGYWSGEKIAKAGKSWGLLEVHLEAHSKKRQQYFPALRHIWKAEPLRGKQKTMVGKSGKRRCTAGEWAKRVVRLWVSRSQVKSSAVPQHPTDSPASAKLIVGWRRRSSLGRDGRQAKAKDSSRELGSGLHWIARTIGGGVVQRHRRRRFVNKCMTPTR